VEVKLYARLAGSHSGSSLLFGGAFFAATLATEGPAQAVMAGSLAATSWFAIVPLLKRLSGGEPA
jgi:hypothetical protein